MKRPLAVRMHDINADPITYLTRSRQGCIDEHDRRVYDLVLEHSGVITIGKTIGEPLYNEAAIATYTNNGEQIYN